MWYLKVLLCAALFISSEAKKLKGKSEVLQITDIKDWKKELRTKKNVLALFTESSKGSSKLVTLLDTVSVRMKGLATVIVVDCSAAAKMCKKLKISPKPELLHHYSGGEFNKLYDRKKEEESMVLFLEDPLGDLPWSEDEEARDVSHLDYPSFKRLLHKTSLPVLVMFYAPWCGHCKNMKPEFNGAATEMKGKAVLVGINADGHQGNAPRKELNVTSFPTILYFERGEFQFKFDGERTKTGIVSWLKNPVAKPAEAPLGEEKEWADEEGTAVAHLSSDTFRSFVQEHSSVLVMFYAPWCGHCKAMKPEYSSAALTMLDQGIEGKLAAVDVTKNRELGDEFNVKGFPTVIYFKGGNKTFEHGALRTEKDIISFMKEPKEPPPPAPEEAPWSEQESAVVHVTGDDIDATLKRKKHSLVMFYAPWCGHCKRAKPEITAAAEEMQSNNKVLLGAMDCTQAANRDTCSHYGVKGYPTIVYFNYGDSPHKYSGGRDKASFVNAMSAAKPTSSVEFSPIDISAPSQAPTKRIVVSNDHDEL